MIISLSELQQFLADNGIFASVYDNYMDPTLPPHTVMIETTVDESTVMGVLVPRMPFGLHVLVRNPEQYIEESELQSCVCFGPPTKDCPIHGSDFK
jgi:hypothetical protein